MIYIGTVGNSSWHLYKEYYKILHYLQTHIRQQHNPMASCRATRPEAAPLQGAVNKTPGVRIGDSMWVKGAASTLHCLPTGQWLKIPEGLKRSHKYADVAYPKCKTWQSPCAVKLVLKQGGGWVEMTWGCGAGRGPLIQVIQSPIKYLHNVVCWIYNLEKQKKED